MCSGQQTPSQFKLILIYIVATETAIWKLVCCVLERGCLCICKRMLQIAAAVEAAIFALVLCGQDTQQLCSLLR